MNRTQDYYRHHVERVTSNRNELWNDLFKDDYVRSQVEGKEGTYVFMNGYPETSTRFSKHKPLDCGIPGCVYCHDYKLKKRRFKLNDAEIQDILYQEWGTPVPEELPTVQS